MDQYKHIEDLPDTLKVFPLSGALLFPRWNLPLNIFEPRYLNMFDDAMDGNRLIGMVQTAGGDKAFPELMDVGCVGEVSMFSETEDGRYIVALTGLVRFRIGEELNGQTPYRQVRPDYSEFAHDLESVSDADLPERDVLETALKSYLEKNNMRADWSSIEETPVEPLVNALCAGCPFSTAEKQALIEAPRLKDRALTLIKLLEMDVSGGNKGWLQ